MWCFLVIVQLGLIRKHFVYNLGYLGHGSLPHHFSGQHAQYKSLPHYTVHSTSLLN
jgi:hypothetical protein